MTVTPSDGLVPNLCLLASWRRRGFCDSPKNTEKIDEDFLSTMLDVNVKGAFWGTQAAAEYMEKGSAI